MVAPNSIAKAKELVGDIPDALDKVAVVYDYVVDNFVYDDYKAATVKSGYLPVLDTVLEEKKGICFDYASLMAGMLRSQGVPCKLIVGYAGSAYHAWISVWTEEFGWIDGAIYFDGTMWHRMDPTFASSGQRSEFIMDFINNDYNYSTEYSY
jgi:transglutaminase-like putative cysteine protease